MSDLDLYTGTNSNTFAPVEQEIVRRKREEKQEKRSKLVPSADIVLDEIKKEQEAVKNIEDLAVTTFVFARDTEARLEAKFLYLQYLKQLHNKMQNILREPAKKVVNDE